MEAKNLFKKISFGLICFLLLISVSINIFLYQKMKKAIPEVGQESLVNNQSVDNETPKDKQSSQENNTQSAELSDIGAEYSKNDIDELIYQLEASEEELDMAQKQLSDALAKKNDTANDMMQGPMEMLKTSEGKKKLRNALKNGFDQTYSALFNQLNLSPEKLDELKELLADQSIAMMEVNYGIQGVSPTEEDRKILQQRLEDRKTQNDADLAALLGSQDFQTFKDYEDRSQERMIVQMVSQRLGYDDTLTGEQKKSLMEAMYKERKDVYSQLGYAEGKMIFPSEINDEGMAKIMEMNDRLYDGYIKCVEEAALSASQAKQIREYLEKEQAMMGSSMRQSARMSGEETTQDGTEPDGEDEPSREMVIIMR